MLRQRRGAGLCSDDATTHHSILKPPPRPADDEVHEGRQPLAAAVESQHRIRPFLYSSLHIFSVVCLIISVVLAQTKLHTHQECEMTYSRRQFVELSALSAAAAAASSSDSSSSSSESSYYRVFKFMDQRDPRHRSLLTQQAVADDSWCLSLPIVLYVPGHGGSYEQSRSLGAHGTQLTGRSSPHPNERRILRKLRNLHESHPTQNHNNTDRKVDMDDFFYDVVALDFGEEGGGFHGAFLERQAAFIADTVSRIAATCQIHSEDDDSKPLVITIVAHSIGGISTRLALQAHADKMAPVRNVVTLGTPHAHPVLSWESSLWRIYRRTLLKQDESQARNNNNRNQTDPTVVMVSVSGGIRDEMIPPRACWVDESAGLSLLATDFMPNGTAMEIPVQFGMDHRAVVWCHNLLSEVRSILYTMIHHSDDNNASTLTSRVSMVRQRLQLPFNDDDDKVNDYRLSVGTIPSRLQETYGHLTAFAMETGLLYNAEIMVNAYACLGAWRYLHSDTFAVGSSTSWLLWLPALLFAVIQYLILMGLHSHAAPRFGSVLVLAYAADAVFLSFQWSLNCFLRGRWAELIFLEGAVIEDKWFRGTLAVLFAIALYQLLGFPPKANLSLLSLGVVYVLAFTVVAGLPREDCRCRSPELKDWRDRQISFVVWTMVLLPILSIGDVVASVKGLATTTAITVAFVIPVGLRLWIVLPVYFKIVSHPNVRGIPSGCFWYWLHAATLSLACWGLLQGTGFEWWPFHPLSLPLTACAVEDCFEIVYLRKSAGK